MLAIRFQFFAVIRRVRSNLNFRCFYEIEHDAGGNSGRCIISVRAGFLLNFLLHFSHSNFITVHILLFCDVV